MSEQTVYIVRDRDTLGSIAKANDASVLELVSLNRIADPDRIAVGQRLILPAKSAVANVEAEVAEWGALQVRFVDAINRDISGLAVTIDNGVCKPFEMITDGAGLLPAFAVHPDDPPVKISVERAAGGTKEVARIQPTSASQMATLISPKVLVSANLRRHEGPPTPKAIPPQPRPLGQETGTRSPNGHPVHEIAVECPNPQNLKLVANYHLRDFIIAAAKRGNMAPQAIAAIINAEAGTVPKREITETVMDLATGKPKLGKNGKPMIKKRVDPTWRPGEWNALAAANTSSARGLTQFLDGTWIDVAMTEGTHLNARVRKEGWLTTTTIQEQRIKRVKEGKKTVKVVENVPKIVPAFKTSADEFVTAAKGRTLAATLCRSPHITGRATAKGENLQKLLDLRFEPEYAIHAAVDYGMQNVKRLIDAGYNINALNDGDKARVFYMAHHLGFSDAVAFIEETISETRAQLLLEAQVGATSAKKDWAEKNGDEYTLAHRAWLEKFEKDKIKPTEYYCDPSTAIEPRPLLAITASLKKKS